MRLPHELLEHFPAELSFLAFKFVVKAPDLRSAFEELDEGTEIVKVKVAFRLLVRMLLKTQKN